MTILLTISLFIPALYVRIFTELRAQIKKIQPQSTGAFHRTDKLPSRVDVKGVIVIFVTVGLFIFTIFPLIFAVYIECTLFSVSIDSWFVIMFLAFANSLVNPLIYGLGNKTIRQKLFLCICGTKAKGSKKNARKIAVQPKD